MRIRCGFSQRNNPEKSRLWLEKAPNRSTVLPELAGHVSLGRPGHSADLLSHHSLHLRTRVLGELVQLIVQNMLSHTGCS